MAVAGLLGLAITIMIILIIAGVIFFCIKYLTPQFIEPGRLVVGGVALIFILIAVAEYLGVAV